MRAQWRFMDSSTIPVPMDALIAVWVWKDQGHFWAYCLMAAAGSAVGGLLPYALGRAGGELFILKRVNREKYERMKLRFEKQEFLAMAIPSALPPPTPWKAFVFAAGVFEMRVLPFMLAVFTGQAGAVADSVAAGDQAWSGGVGDCAASCADGAGGGVWGGDYRIRDLVDAEAAQRGDWAGELAASMRRGTRDGVAMIEAIGAKNNSSRSRRVASPEEHENVGHLGCPGLKALSYLRLISAA